MNKGTDLSGRRAKLSPIKRALLEKRLKGEDPSLVIGPSIPGTASGTTAPLSFVQEPFWFFHQWDPKTPIYNRPTALRLRGDLNVQAVESSLCEIVSRHEALRTAFPVRDGIPMQRVLPPGDMALPIEDLTHLAPADREVAARGLMREVSKQPFNLETEPPLEMRLYRLAPDEHILLFLTHQMVFDHWSENVFLDELGTLYMSSLTGEPVTLPQPAIQYPDFARWQRSQTQTERTETQLAYWKEQLASPLAALELPTDRPRPPVQSFAGARHSFVLPAPLVKQLKELSQQEGATLFMGLLAAFQVLLYRYTGQEDIVVGSPISGRNTVETERIIGAFINVLALRSDLTGSPTFRELLGRARRVCLEAYANQDVPFERVVGEVRPGRVLNRTPLFQVMLNLENVPAKSIDLPGLHVERLELDTETSLFDLSLELVERPVGIHCLFELNTDLFEPATVRRMAGHFRTLLEGIAIDPDQPIGLLPMLTEAEEYQILVEWNDTRMAYPADTCLHHLLEERAEQSPGAVAVVFGDQQLTYRQLNSRANQLAHHLCHLGVGVGSLVALFVDQSVEMLVGIMGTWKAGAAYVPVDVHHPPQRVDSVLEDAQVGAILTQQKLVRRLADYADNTICLDTDWPAIARHSDENPLATVTPNDLAYVIYTSGSTGEPKGCLIHHGGPVNHLFGIRQAIYAQHPERGRQATLNFPLGFDISIGDILRMLTGFCMHIVPEGIRVDGRKMVEFLEEREVNLLYTTPAQLELMIAAGFFEEGRHRPQLVLVGGEAMRDRLWRSLTGASCAAFYNSYGPTECTVSATACRLTPDLPTNVLGWALPNRRLYILDRNMQPVPIGVTGEICIGGTGVGLGYLNRPELTAERFVPDPFSSQAGARLYRTGDLGRHLPDGSVQFLERVDQQVKLRGFRIELGEIEAVLGQHHLVQEASVLAREDRPGEKRLVGYFVSKGEPSPSADELRHFLRQSLPDYMLPSAFVRLDRFPLTPSGKTDHRALPAPGPARPDLEAAFVAPRTPLEEELARIWTQVLGLERVGVHDNFFELGGHSLFVVQVIARILDAFQVEVPPKCIFESPTIAELAKAVEKALSTRADDPEPDLVPLKRERYRTKRPLNRH